MTRPLRFGVVTLQNAPWTTLVERWQYLDDLDLDSVWVADHFTNPFFPSKPWLEGWTFLSALAAHTGRIRLGTMVTMTGAWSNAAWIGGRWNVSPQK